MNLSNASHTNIPVVNRSFLNIKIYLLAIPSINKSNIESILDISNENSPNHLHLYMPII